MSLAALTPIVRVFLFCDEVVPSDIEDAVFNLEGLRQQVLVESFPHWHSLNVFLSMAYQRGGTFRGSITLIQDETGEVIGEEDFVVNMDSDDDAIFLPVELGSCIFPEPGGCVRVGHPAKSRRGHLRPASDRPPRRALLHIGWRDHAHDVPRRTRRRRRRAEQRTLNFDLAIEFHFRQRNARHPPPRNDVVTSNV